MEKTVSAEDRIKRAEEIYYRRKSDNNSIRMPGSQVKDGQGKKKFSLYKKMVIQILICILIYLVFSLIKEANYIFSEDVLNKTKHFLSTDVNFEVISRNVGQFFQNNQDKFGFFGNWVNDNNVNQNEQNVNQTQEDAKNEGENTNTENKLSNSVENTNTENEASNKVENQNVQNNSESGFKNNEEQNNTNTAKNNNTVGVGGTKNEKTVSTSSNSSSASKTQMQLDAEYIKKNFILTLPVKGKVTSKYGKRTPTEIISENHQGIDIGVNTGTNIVAAMAGKVTLVSKEGEYGTHVKIENKDVTTIYAHCSKILVKKGATIKKGQKIALSGNTGNTTGPHLHFEIRRNNRTVNPELVLSW